MMRYLAGRLLRALLTIFLVVTFAFFVLRLSGDPALLIMSVDAPPESVEAFRKSWGLDQPIWMQTRSGPLLSVPYPMELNDAGSQAHRDHTGREFGEMIVDQFEEMLEQSERQPLVFALALHGFIVGQPVRLRPVRQAIKHCVEHKHKDRVWYTRAGDIAKHCFSLPKGLIPGSA